MKKRNIQQFLLPILILIALLCFIQYAIDYGYDSRSTHKFSEVFRHRADAEVMIFGSSVAYQDIDPRIIQGATGKTSYNMGWDGIFFVQYNCLIKEYLSYESQCRYIVIACDFENLGKNELISRPDLFMAYVNNNHVYQSLHEIEPVKIFCSRFIPGYKLTILNKNFYKDMLMSAPDSNSLLGFGPSHEAWDKTGDEKPENARYDEHIFNELRSTIDEINKKGIKVILVMTPVYEAGYKLIPNSEWIKSKYRSLSNKDVYFLDYTADSMCKTKAYFHNYGHLNETGANVFSHTFTNDLLRIIHE